MSYGRMQQEEARLSAEIEARQAAAEALGCRGGCPTRPGSAGRRGARGPATPEKSAGRHPGSSGRAGGAARAEMRGRYLGGSTARQTHPTRQSLPQSPAVTPKPQSQYNFTGPESRIMKTSQDGFQQCYNAQIVVDADTQLIVTAAVSAQASDQGQLPLPAGCRAGTLRPHPHPACLADAGYRNEGDLQELETRGIDGYVALGREGHTASRRKPPRSCHPGACRPNWTPHRGSKRMPSASGWWKRPSAWIKRILGFRQFGMRGLHPVQGEWDLVCLALNVKRLHRLLRN